MAEEVLKVSHEGNRLTLTLNRPERRNALNTELMQALESALDSLEGNRQIRAVLIRGEGKAFCAGIDLQEADADTGARDPLQLTRLLGRLESLPIPTVAAVQGAALAGGLELALHCDLRIAARAAKLGMTVSKVGLVPTYHLVRKLISTVGGPNTAYLLLSAELVSGPRAREMGLVHEIVNGPALDQTAANLADTIAGNAPLSIKAMKATIRRCLSETFRADHVDLDEMIQDITRSEDAREGIRAFMEKRKPVWQGF